MDDNRFDAFTKSLAAAPSRRGVMRALGLALGAGYDSYSLTVNACGASVDAQFAPASGSQKRIRGS